MYFDGDLGFNLFLEQEINHVVEVLFEQDGGFDFAGAVADGALFEDVDVGDGADALAGDLHQAELAEWQHGMSGAVGCHQFLHLFVEGCAVGSEGHVDEVDDDDAADIAEAHLSGDFRGGGHVHLQGVLFLRVGGLDAVAAVDVNHAHRLGLFNHEVDAVLDGDDFPER